jgi:hypothetical protein
MEGMIMSDDYTPRLALPLLSAGQAQKEMTHNEALAALDMLAQAVAVAVGVDVPPAAPEPGQCWIVGDAPQGVWSGQARTLAGWTVGGWRFHIPDAGMTVWSLADAAEARFEDGGWTIGVARAARVEIGGVQVLGPRQPAIAEPGGGTVIDAEARAAIGAILAALHTHGLIAVPPPVPAG